MSRLVCAVAVAASALLCCSSASAQEIDAAYRADLEKLLDVSGAASLGSKMAEITSAQLIDAMKKNQPDAPPRAFEIIREVLLAEFSHFFDDPQVRTDMVQMYAKVFSRQEVTALLEFYSSDLGRKAISVMPRLAEEGAGVGQRWAVANAPRVLGIIQQRLRDEKLIR